MVPYIYKAKVVRVVDGDTLDLEIDVGFRMTTIQRVRLVDYNAPETKGPEASLGERAALALAVALRDAEIVVHTYKGDAFGRWLADIYLPGGTNLVASLVQAGYGVRWDGKGKRPAFDPSKPYPLIGN